MDKLEYFSEVMQIVTELTDISGDEILSSCRKSEVVDARWLVIQLMYEKGYKAKDMVPLLKCARISIDNAICQFDNRLNSSPNNLKSTLAISRNCLGNKSC
jgi:hypothetical protein